MARIPNLDLLGVRNVFGIRNPYLLRDYNDYTMEAPIDEGLASIDTGLPIYIPSSDGGNNYFEQNKEVSPRTINTQSDLVPLDTSIDVGIPDNESGFVDPLGTIKSAPNVFDINKIGFQDPTVMEIANYEELFGGQRSTTDALAKDFNGLGNFLKDKSIQGFDFAKQIPGMAISAITGVPFLGQGLVSLLSGIKESPEQKAMKDFYGKEFGLTDTGQIASGIMKGYNPVYGFGGSGLTNAIDKRLATILKTEQRKKKKGLELSQELINRRKELEALKAKESAASSAALEAQRRGRRPGSGGDGPGTEDSGGPTGGYSYDGGGRQGFGYGL